MVLRERAATRMGWALLWLSLGVAGVVVVLARLILAAGWLELMLIAAGSAVAVWSGARALLSRAVRLLREQLREDVEIFSRMPPPAPLSEGGQARIERRRSVDGLSVRLNRLRALADSSYGLEALFDGEGRLLWINQSVETLTGYSRQACMEEAEDLAGLLVFEPDRAYFRMGLDKILASTPGSGLKVQDELRLLRHDGSTNWVACHWVVFPLEESERGVGARLSAEDIQGRKEAEYQLLETVAQLRRAQALSEHYLERSRDERERLLALFNVMRQGILFMGPDCRIQHVNQAFLRMWGYAPSENLIGVRDVVWQSHVAGRMVFPEGFLAHVAEVMACRAVSEPFEAALADGRVVTDITAVVGGDHGRAPIGRMWMWEDVTEQRRTARQLVEIAERDALTNLFNRRRFVEESERMLADAARRGWLLGMLMIDLDSFKPINDSYGHAAGDEVLVSMARSVGQIVRRNEMFFRLGGDEFAILVPDAKPSDLEELARRVVDCIARMQFHFGGVVSRITGSVGIALYPLHAKDADGLARAADGAMYCSKKDGRNRWCMASECAQACHAAEAGAAFSDKMPRSGNASVSRED